MKRDGHIPVESLTGRDLDVAVYEEVRSNPAYVVDPDGMEAELSMAGAAETEGLRTAWEAEAEEYKEHQKEVVCPHYSTDLGDAMDLDTYMREEHPSPEVRRHYRELQGEDPAGMSRRGLGEKTATVRVDPPEICRAALRAVREESWEQERQ